MSATNIRALKGRHSGETVYVVGSGASVDPKYTPPSFWRGKLIVAVNEIWQQIPLDAREHLFVLAHHHEQLQAAIDAGLRVVASSVDLGRPGWGKPHAFTGDYFVYTVTPYTISVTPSINARALTLSTLDDRLVSSACTVSEALQFAAHLGAACIVCCGMDGAALDGQWCTTGYNVDHTGQSAQTNPQHVRLTKDIIRITVQALRDRGICVTAHDPFIGFDHEGHVYTPAPALTGRALLDALGTTNYQQPTEVAS